MSKILLNYTKRSNSSNSSFSNYGNNSAGAREYDEIYYSYNQKSNDEKRSNSSFNKSPSSTSKSSTGERKELEEYFKNSPTNDSYVVEETHDDCVYQITLKKVFKNKSSPPSSQSKQKVNPSGTYKPLSSSGFYSYLNEEADTSPSSNGSPNGVNSNNSENNGIDGLVYTRVKIKQLKYATLEKFIEHLTNEETGELDSNLVQTFLATYRTFTDPPTVIKMLRKRLEKILPASLEMTEDVRQEHLKSIRSILYIWLDYYNEDFNEPIEYQNLNMLNKFAHDYFYETELVKLIRKKFELYEEANNTNNFQSTSFPSNKNLINENKLSMSDEYTPLKPPTPLSQLSDSSALNPEQKVTNHRRSSSNSNISGKLSYSNSSLAQSKASLINSLSNLHIKSSDKDTPIINSSSLFNFFCSSNKKSSTSSSNLDDSTFMLIDSNYFAQQLTYIDKCLFQNVCAHHCLGSVWSTRYQKTVKNSTNNTTTSIISNNSDLNGNYLNGGGDALLLPRASLSNSNILTPTLSEKFASIRSFIDQFNCVSFVVQGTILDKIDLKPSERAKIIKKWIEIAQECRIYKNFSSLNAIVQGLNTQCVSRLEKTWNEVPAETKAQFDELTEMFSQDQNQKIFREILMKDLNKYAEIFDYNESTGDSSSDNKKTHKYQNNKNINKLQLKNELEGTAKYADINSGINATLSRKMKEKLISQQLKNQFKEPLGTVPFLGTFLKDLEYIHAQNPTKNEKGQINVMQKRKEFEIVAQIKLLQKASHLYNIIPDPDFEVWLRQLPSYSEAQNYEFSYMIEPKFERENSNNSSNYNRKNKMSSSQPSRSESVESINSINNQNANKISTSKAKLAQLNQKDHSRNSSLGSSDMFDSSGKSKATDNYSSSNGSNSFNEIQRNDLTSSKQVTSSSEMRVKVNIESNNDQPNGNGSSLVVYKYISITDKHRTNNVKRLILEKFFLNADLCDKYTLVQILNPNHNNSSNQHLASSQNELVINDNCNVFYAAKRVENMQFLLKRKSSPIYQNVNLNSSYNGLNSNLKNEESAQSPSFNNNRKFRSSIKTSSQVNLNRKENILTDKNGNFFDELPPQSPSRHHKHNNTSKNHSNSNSSWQLFKKILS